MLCIVASFVVVLFLFVSFVFVLGIVIEICCFTVGCLRYVWCLLGFCFVLRGFVLLLVYLMDSATLVCWLWFIEVCVWTVSFILVIGLLLCLFSLCLGCCLFCLSITLDVLVVLIVLLFYLILFYVVFPVRLIICLSVCVCFICVY